ncbi:hypothetical protein GQR58_009209 [Nymphon striatum]|nr:hypothetical protein GQR58_009209 [Nymphon striatum]
MAANRQSEIVAIKNTRFCTKDMASRVGVVPKTVYNVMKRYSETGSIESKPHTGRKRSLVALNFRCPCMTIDQQDHPKLFQVMALYGIRGIRESSTGLIKEIIFIYPLKHVPDIIHALSHKSPYLEEDLIELYKNFDGNSPYWKGEVSSEIDEDSVNKDPALVEIENLRSSLIMEKREHLMHMLEDVNVKGSVKLKQIEDQIDTVDSIIEQMKSKMKNLAEDTMNRSTPDGASEEKKLSTSCYINSDLDVNSTEFSSSNFKI